MRTTFCNELYRLQSRKTTRCELQNGSHEGRFSIVHTFDSFFFEGRGGVCRPLARTALAPPIAAPTCLRLIPKTYESTSSRLVAVNLVSRPGVGASSSSCSVLSPSVPFCGVTIVGDLSVSKSIASDDFSGVSCVANMSSTFFFSY